MLVVNLLRTIVEQDIFVNNFAVMQIADKTHRTGGAERTADALLRLRHLHGGVPLLVQPGVGEGEDVLGAGVHAQAAALAQILSKG